MSGIFGVLGPHCGVWSHPRQRCQFGQEGEGDAGYLNQCSWNDQGFAPWLFFFFIIIIL